MKTETIFILATGYLFIMHWSAWRIARYYPDKARFCINLSWVWPIILIISIPYAFRNRYVKMTGKVDPEISKKIDEYLKKKEA